ncbi:hypothetical protein BBP40_012591 [Aspergillus hancockii]|nr:hypothetical protein BBP40_012591 [Aspergillus hancockii]
MAILYDFVIVGSGPAGSALAAKLSQSPQRPQVLLLEAGSRNDDPNLRIDGQRWVTFQQQHMNWGYKTVPQPNCLDREIDYARGKCLGGSSAINFGFYTIGPKDDYDEWARIVGDAAFNWDNMHRRFKDLETFHNKCPQDVKYARPEVSNHGSYGPLHVGYTAEWERDLVPLLDVFEQAGFPSNPDHNSGDPLGMSIIISSAHNGLRSTAADLLTSPPDNLTIVSDAVVKRLLVEGTDIVGVEASGTQYRATKEVILAAGTLNTPHILMHSGIGPVDQLSKYGIPLLKDCPVGKGLRDHCFAPTVFARAKGSNDRAEFYGSKEAMDLALNQWSIDRSGDWSKFACASGIGFFKSERITDSAEFQSLPLDTQQYLQEDTIPHYEVVTHIPAHWFAPNFPDEHLCYAALNCFVLNNQSIGEVSLQSSDPQAPLRFDPKILSHDFDQRVAIEALRDLLKVASHPEFAKDTIGVICGPKSDSGEDLLDHWRQTTGSTWHMTGTAKMGSYTDPDAVVDPDFRVIGLTGLRVADMSVVPILPNAHTQAVAYVTGLTCAEKVIEEYKLDQ